MNGLSKVSSTLQDPSTSVDSLPDYVIVSKSALGIALGALDRDAKKGKHARGEIAALVRRSVKPLPLTRPLPPDSSVC